MKLINKKENIFGDDIAFVEQFETSLVDTVVKFEKVKLIETYEVEL